MILRLQNAQIKHIQHQPSDIIIGEYIQDKNAVLAGLNDPNPANHVAIILRGLVLQQGVVLALTMKRGAEKQLTKDEDDVEEVEV